MDQGHWRTHLDGPRDHTAHSILGRGNRRDHRVAHSGHRRGGVLSCEAHGGAEGAKIRVIKLGCRRVASLHDDLIFHSAAVFDPAEVNIHETVADQGILLATDFSQCAEQALEYTAFLGNICPAPVEILHVVGALILARGQQEQVASRLADLCHELRRQGITVETVVGGGSTAEAILVEATRVDVAGSSWAHAGDEASLA